VLVARDALPAVILPPGRYTMTAKIGDGSAALSRTFSIVAAGGEAAGAAPSAAPDP
jgi:hypothetical protein